MSDSPHLSDRGQREAERDAAIREVFRGTWIDENGHTWQATSMHGWGDGDTEVTLHWVPPSSKTVTLAELRGLHARQGSPASDEQEAQR